MHSKTEEARQAMRARAFIATSLCVLLGAMTIGVAGAMAFREGIEQTGGGEKTPAWLLTDKAPSPEGKVEGACGVALSPLSGGIYVSDYYHRAVDVFSPGGVYAGSIKLAGGDPPVGKSNELNAVCGLAFDSSGRLYANELHKRVMVLSGEQVVDSGNSTGVAVDGADNVYVDDRTYVAFYEAPVTPGEAPAAKIGLGTLGEGYGVAVDPIGKRVYVPDAASDSIKVYEPAVSLVNPVEAIETPEPPPGQVDSLADAAITVDGSVGEGSGHLLVVEDLKLGAEDPEAAIYEFDAKGKYLNTLQRGSYTVLGRVLEGPIFGEPSAIVVDPENGELLVTTGNSEGSNVFKYGPFEPFAPPALAAPSSVPVAPATAGSAGAHSGAGAAAPASAPRRGGSESVVVRRGPVQVSFGGRLTPHSLPRHGTAPVGIVVDARITGTKGGAPPQLRRIAIAINRNGQLSAEGLPVCRESQIQPSTTSGARAACGEALVGEGHFAANVKLPEQSPFPSSGKVLAFNGRLHGRPAILAQIYGTQPAPTSYVLPFSIRSSHGTYGTVLEASLPQATGDWGYVTGLKMNLRRSFRYHGKRHSYLSAGCPAPAGFPSAVFPLARTRFAFAGDLNVTSILNRTCTAKG
jgi:DNA-binding beta-propeller fold protein YncE